MDNNQNQPQTTPVPEIPQGELKMPAETVPSAESSAPAPKFHISPLLIILLIFTLTLLGAVIFWGDKIIELLMPMEQAPVMMDAAMDTGTTTDKEVTPSKTAEEEIAEIEAEASSTEAELSETDAELDAIEAEIEAGLE